MMTTKRDLDSGQPGALEQHAPLDLARLRKLLGRTVEDTRVGSAIEYAPAMPSTMLPAHAAAQAAQEQGAGVPHGLVVLTEEQTAGRGRRGREWQAPPARGVLMSVLLAHAGLVQQLPWLPLVTGLAVQQAVAETIGAIAPTAEATVRLKWPNDIVWAPHMEHGATDLAALGKLGGMLVESVVHKESGSGQPESGSGPGIVYAVLGIGINVNQIATELPPVTPPALPPKSLRMVTGQFLDRTIVVARICRRLEEGLQMLGKDACGAQDLVAVWQARLALMGEPILVFPRAGTPYPAVARAVTRLGELVVENETGEIEVLVADEVSVRPRHEPN